MLGRHQGRLGEGAPTRASRMGGSTGKKKEWEAQQVAMVWGVGGWER